MVHNHNLHKALSWLAVDGINVIAFKYIPDKEELPVILIDPVGHLSDGQILNGCVLKFKRNIE